MGSPFEALDDDLFNVHLDRGALSGARSHGSTPTTLNRTSKGWAVTWRETAICCVMYHQWSVFCAHHLIAVAQKTRLEYFTLFSVTASGLVQG